MTGQFRLEPEIAGGGHQPSTEEGVPGAVHGDAGDERIALGIDEPPRKAEPVGLGSLGQGRKHLRHRGSDSFLRLEVFAAMMAMGRARVVGGTFLHDQGGG